MNSTFDEALSNFVAPGAAPLAEMKQTLAPTLADLRELKRHFPKTKAAWHARLDRISARVHAAQSLGVFRSSIASHMANLTGGGYLHGGLIVATEQQIDTAIARIEGITPANLQQRRWVSWPQEPTKIRDNFLEVDRLLLQLEDAVKNGGELENLIRQRSGQPVVAPVLVAPQRDPAMIQVES